MFFSFPNSFYNLPSRYHAANNWYQICTVLVHVIFDSCRSRSSSSPHSLYHTPKPTNHHESRHQTFVEVKWEARLSEQDESWGRKFIDLKTAHGNRLFALEQATCTLPPIEGTIDDIRLEVNKLTKHWERIVLEQSPLPSLYPTPPTPECLPTPCFVERPNGRNTRNTTGSSRSWFIPWSRVHCYNSTTPCGAPPYDYVHGRESSNNHCAHHFVAFLRSIFLNLMAPILSCGFVDVRITSIFVKSSLTCGSKWPLCILLNLLLLGCSQ